MAPAQPPAAAGARTPSPPCLPRPRLRLECRDLSHEGSRAFFQHCPRPDRLLEDAVTAVLRALYPTETLDEDRTPVGSSVPPIRCIGLYLHVFEGVAYTCSSDLDPLHKEIHLSVSYLAGVEERSRLKPELVALEIRGVVTHEMVHVFQHNGKGTVPGGVIEGIADWVRDRADLGAPHWHRSRPEQHDRWDQGYEKTAFFLSWLASRVGTPDLIARLNRALQREEWQGGAVLERLLGGADVERLFREYRDSFSGDGPTKDGPPAPVPTHVASV
ncbi:hypothetical protein JCM3774_002190 [Rhodotorula dairenensis]